MQKHSYWEVIAMLLRFHVFSQTNGEKWGEMKIFLLFSFIYYKKRLTLQKIPYCVLLRLRKGALPMG